MCYTIINDLQNKQNAGIENEKNYSSITLHSAYF
jgi:hypothetical protein